MDADVREIVQLVSIEAAAIGAPVPVETRKMVPFESIASTPDDKVRLFHALFAARTSVYPKFWENTSKGIKGYLLTQFFRLKPRAGRLLVYALKEEINNSKVWSVSQKAGILSNLKTVLVKNWHWSEADYLGISPANESLINRCVRLLIGS